MKKLLIVTNFLFLALAAYFGYKLYNNKFPRPTVDTNELPGKCSSKICNDYTGTDWYGRITGYQSELLKRFYRSSAGKNVIWNGEVRTGEEDSKAAWFPIDVIKRFIWQIEKQNCGNKCSDSIGLRVYYGKYPGITDPSWSRFGIPDRYANHHTIFFVPTYWDGKKHIDFDPWLGCHKEIVIDSLSSVAPNPSILLIGTGDDEAQNHGSLIPPDHG